jgi:cold shock CspA family protein
MEGTVLQFNRQTGWGFIRPDSPDQPDFFVCYKFINAETKFERFLKAGQRVSFDPTDIDTKPQARNVSKLPTVIAIQRSAPNAGGVR